MAILAKIDDEAELFITDPDRSSIISELSSIRVVEVTAEGQFVRNEGSGRSAATFHHFPIGTKIVKLS